MTTSSGQGCLNMGRANSDLENENRKNPLDIKSAPHRSGCHLTMTEIVDIVDCFCCCFVIVLAEDGEREGIKWVLPLGKLWFDGEFGLEAGWPGLWLFALLNGIVFYFWFRF